jgi:DNA repair exonuclease SbcCD ATPase subunit
MLIIGPSQNEAGAAHSVELHAFMAKSQATVEQIQSVQQSTIESLKAEHAAILDEQVKALEKKLDNRNIDLKATQDDLTKAKTALEAAQSDIANLQAQRDEARAAAEVAAATSPKQLAEIQRLTQEVSRAKDDLAALTEMLNLTKTSLTEVTNNHTKDLEESAKGRAEEVKKLRAAHDEEMRTLASQKSELLLRLSDLESELSTAKASLAAIPSPSPTSPRTNGHGAPHIAPGVTREELQQLHEAHNLKIHDLQAEHDRAIRVLKEELEASREKASEVQRDVDRRVMEIQYLEQEQEESQDQITRYVRFFGLKSIIGGIIALGVILGLA